MGRQPGEHVPRYRRDPEELQDGSMVHAYVEQLEVYPKQRPHHPHRTVPSFNDPQDTGQKLGGRSDCGKFEMEGC